jgi:1,4-alpha-glucan branching enzyme
MKMPKLTKSNVKKTDFSREVPDFYGTSQSRDGVTFSALFPKAGTVQIAGDFNNWQPERTPMHKIDENGTWRTKVNLAPGTYRYRLVVDGQWQQDPFNEKSEPNPFGELNSVLQVD